MKTNVQKGVSIQMAENDNFVEKILSHGPSAGSLVLILRRMKGEGRLNEVVQACLRFLTLYPDDVRLRTLLAESYAEMGFITLAGAELEKVAAVIDDMASAYLLLADIYARQQRDSEAADMLRRYLAHYPGQVEALEFLRRMETALLPEEALFETEGPAEDLAPSGDESEDALVDFATPTIAELYYSQGRIDAAIHTYEKVLGSNPADNESLRRLKELKRMAAESSDAEEKRADAVRGQKERMITILERWLPKIREIRYAQ
jgi:tetratricopeptide (TPR) repeat protein